MDIIQTSDPRIYKIKTESRTEFIINSIVNPLYFITVFIIILIAIILEDPAWYRKWGMAALGLFFIIAGIWMHYKRSYVIVDMRERVVIKWEGRYILLRRRKCFIDQYNRLSLGEAVPTDQSGFLSYPVYMISTINLLPVQLALVKGKENAEIFAERLAKILELPFQKMETQN